MRVYAPGGLVGVSIQSDSAMTQKIQFDAGPRLNDSPKGDEAAQAIASLRGYAYQLYMSGLAWIDLTTDQDLYLEVAKDYAVVSANALQGVEVKDRPKSKMTINSESIRSTLDAFVGLVELNPQREVQLRFLSTSDIGKERSKAHQVAGKPALEYWRRAAAGDEVGPLREVLARLKLAPNTHRYLDRMTDDQLREQFLRRIHWDCGAAPLSDVEADLGIAIGRYVTGVLDARTIDADQLMPALILKILKTIVSTRDRKLTPLDLKVTLNAAMTVPVARALFDQLMSAVGQNLQAQGARSNVVVTKNDGIVESVVDSPLPLIIAPRALLVSDLLARVRRHRIGFITGSTGTGKTLLARFAANAAGGSWSIVDFRNLTAPGAAERLVDARGIIAGLHLEGVVLDDLNEIEDPAVTKALVSFAAVAQRRDVLCLVTLYLRPSARVMATLGIEQAASIDTPYFTEIEVRDLINLAGGDGHKWATAVLRASAFGHPQMTQALISGLRARAWPIAERVRLTAFEGSSDVEAEKLATRRQLIAALPEDARELLYRTSLAIGRFERSLVGAIADLEPAVRNPGALLDLLIGPWVEQVTENQLRISPLLQSAGADVFGKTQISSIHRALAEYLFKDRAVNVSNIDAGFLHALLGNAERILFKLAVSVITAHGKERRALANWMTGLRLHRQDRPIVGDNPSVSAMLRLAQFLLVSVKGDDAATVGCWETLAREMKSLTGNAAGENIRYMAVTKALLVEEAAGILPDWIDLILEFASLTKKTPARSAMLEKPPSQGRLSTTVGTFFILQVMRVRNVEALRKAFERLNGLGANDRQLLLADLTRNPQECGYVVDHAWLTEAKGATPDWLACSEAFRGMGDMALTWPHRPLALRCYIARAIVLDEYAKDPVSAQKALDEAAARFGEDPRLSRARAKILFRQRDHQGALTFLKLAANNEELKDPIESAFLFREVAISSAETGDWAQSRRWFEKAREAAGQSKASAMTVMTIGLWADEGIAAYMSADPEAALQLMNSALAEVESLDPAASILSGYCHRVVRHAVLWLFGECTRQKLHVAEQPVVMVPGMCSNPEPTDMSSLPLGSIDYVRYLLLQSAIETDATIEVQAQIAAGLGGREIPAMEYMIRQSRLARAMAQENVDGVLVTCDDWLAARVYLATHEAELRSQGPNNPGYGRIPLCTTEELEGPIARSALRDLMTTFGLFAAFHHKPQAVELLRDALSGRAFPLGADRSILETIRTGQPNEDTVAWRLFDTLHERRLSPEALFAAGLRFVQFADTSQFKRQLAVHMRRWMHDCWTYVIEQQTFLLRNPRLTVPDIKVAINSTDEGLGYVGKILLSVEPAISSKLDPSFRTYLCALEA
jgi:hypothetical protein